MKHEPSYIALLRSGVLGERVKTAKDLLKECRVCPRECGVNRLEDKRGFCRTGALPVVSSFGPHFGEEPPLVGSHGSGTIFITHCNMRCEFCQNYEISQCGQGTELEIRTLGEIMLKLQDRGCHNINFVTPTHVVPQILEALEYAAREGLAIPLVYNSGGYDSVETLRLLDGVFDIYMPDAKYGDDRVAMALSHAPGYTRFMKAALLEMQRQVGDLVIEGGLALRGLIIRHLVLPGDLAGTEKVMRFIAEEISRDAYVNVMAQYRPMWHVLEPGDNPLLRRLRRPITLEEYRYAISCARRAGLHRGFSDLC
ncbi:MAG: radical SAM protein [Methanomicrobiales archaeon]|nr:radical SAM protein [Methanomicrobiales archaeon]